MSKSSFVCKDLWFLPEFGKFGKDLWFLPECGKFGKMELCAKQNLIAFFFKLSAWLRAFLRLVAMTNQLG